MRNPPSLKIEKYLQSSPIFALNAAAESILPLVNRRLRPEGTNLLQGLVLTALFFEDQTQITPSLLADLFHTSRGNMSHIISSLESRRWVQRVVNSRDARGFHILLTADGRKKALSLIKFYDGLQRSLEKGLGPQTCRRLNGSLRTMMKLMKHS